MIISAVIVTSEQLLFPTLWMPKVKLQLMYLLYMHLHVCVYAWYTHAYYVGVCSLKMRKTWYA